MIDPHRLQYEVTLQRLRSSGIVRLVALVVTWALLASAAGQGTPSGEYGSLPLGGSVEGTLAPALGHEGAVYHTYVVTIPPASGPVTVTVEGFGSDIDLALKLGAPIVDYDDVDVLDLSEDPDPRHTFAAPPAGPLYVDVLNLMPAPARYRLSVSAGPSAPVPATPAGAAPASTTPSSATPTNPLVAASDPLLGTFEGDGLVAQVSGGVGAFFGELQLAGTTYPFEATGGAGRLEGAFVSAGTSFAFTATVDGDALTLTSGGATYRLQRVGGPAAGSTNPLGAPAGASNDGAAGRAAVAPAASDPDDPVVASGHAATLTHDNALAFIEALAFSLAQVGYTYPISEAEQAQLLQAMAQGYGTLTPADQAVLAHAREVWTRVQANWASASEEERTEFVLGVFVLAFGEEAVEQALGSGEAATDAAAPPSSNGLGCDTVEACMSRYTPEAYSDMINAQGCWAAAGCESYDPIDNSFSYESYDGF